MCPLRPVTKSLLQAPKRTHPSTRHGSSIREPGSNKVPLTLVCALWVNVPFCPGPLFYQSGCSAQTGYVRLHLAGGATLRKSPRRYHEVITWYLGDPPYLRVLTWRHRVVCGHVVVAFRPARYLLAKLARHSGPLSAFGQRYLPSWSSASSLISFFITILA